MSHIQSAFSGHSSAVGIKDYKEKVGQGRVVGGKIKYATWKPCLDTAKVGSLRSHSSVFHQGATLTFSFAGKGFQAMRIQEATALGSLEIMNSITESNILILKLKISHLFVLFLMCYLNLVKRDERIKDLQFLSKNILFILSM